MGAFRMKSLLFLLTKLAALMRRTIPALRPVTEYFYRRQEPAHS